MIFNNLLAISSVKELAVESVEYAPHSVREVQPPVVWKMFGQCDHVKAFGNFQKYPVEPLVMHRLKNVFVLMPFGLIITEHGEVVAESAYARMDVSKEELRAKFRDMAIENGNLKFTPYGASQIARAVHLENTVLLLSNRWYSNYTHWHMEVLATRAISSASYGDPTVLPLWPTATSNFQSSSMSKVAFPHPGISASWGIFHAKQLLFYTSLSQMTWLQPMIKSGLDPILKNWRHAGQNGNSPQKIYISRADSKVRPLLNEKELEDALANMGFFIFCASNYCYDEQIALFSNCKMIVAPHGSGMTNMIFSPPGAIVLEIRPSDAEGRSPFWDKSFWIMADIFGHQYGAVVVEASPLAQAWAIDVRVVLDAISGLAA